MRNFIIIKNGKVIDMTLESGNLQALCTTIKLTGLPESIHIHEGLLFAKINDDIFMVFDCTDASAHDIALSVINEAKGVAVKKPIVLKLPRLFILPKITMPSLAMEVPHYVV